MGKRSRAGSTAMAGTVAVPRALPSAEHVVDVHLVWERQVKKLDAMDLGTADEQTFQAVCAQIAHLEDLLLSTPARTLEGAMAQIRRVMTILAQSDLDEREQHGLRLALATLAKLRRA
ncbi:hypothetical protein [Benzoatithermus flavus]